MPELIGLDFETYSAVDLKKHGLHRYVNHPTFTPLLGALVRNDKSFDEHVLELDFVHDRDYSVNRLYQAAENYTFVCHNAPFEAAVLSWLGLDLPASKFIDSAVVARAVGAGGSLEAAAPQLLDVDKIDQGKDLIKLFSVPGPYQEKYDTQHFVSEVCKDHAQEWKDFARYCTHDARLGLHIVRSYLDQIPHKELEFAATTLEMNFTGWPVDVEMVAEMHRRYLENQAAALEEFRVQCDAPDLNLNSLVQMKKWCAERGIKAKSFDEKHVASMLKRIEAKLDSGTLPDDKYFEYRQVAQLLRTKQILGGSSLKKLQVILDTVGVDGRLRDQYLHIGAGQSWRTTGRSVQMQNLKRLGNEVEDVSVLIDDPDCEWDNPRLAKNIRQVFRSAWEDGRLIVGDFSSVESRGLAWLAREDWKLASYRKGEDLYKVLASRIFGVDYSSISKEQRQTGKVGELSCGYQAGPGAVQAFASNMGIEFTEAEATKLVTDWRSANPHIVAFWGRLDTALHHAMAHTLGSPAIHLPDGFDVRVVRTSTPLSLRNIHPSAVSLALEVRNDRQHVFLRRFFHGCYYRGRDLCYYKPSERKSGPVWRRDYVDPKTGQLRYYNIYGGKLAGILTQSFCRELFMQSLATVRIWVQQHPDSLSLIGQFHDEIVLDWNPAGAVGLDGAKQGLARLMSNPDKALSFPLAAEVKDDYRYTK